MRCVAFTLIVILQPAAALTQTAPPSAGGEAGFDRVWRQFTEWYVDESNPVVQRVLFSGRFQHDFALVDAREGDHHESNTRRLRVGPRVTLFRDLTVHVEAELNPQEIDPLYVRLTDAYVQWRRGRRLAITAGKHSIPFTMDGATSSRELLAIDRSNLANNIWFPQEYLPGVSAAGAAARWQYRAGVYSAGEANKEFGTFSGGAATLASLGYDFADALGADVAVLSVQYVHQTEDPDNTFTRPLGDVVSVSLAVEGAGWGLRGDFSTATGYLRQSDVRGIMAMPFVDITPRLQLVGRYTWLSSAGSNGLLLPTYENRVVAGRGDRYREVYGGANYYFYGHRLKIQSGVQHAAMRDSARDGGAFSGLSWTTGVRIGW